MQTFDWNQLVTDATVPDSATTSPLTAPSDPGQGEDGTLDTDGRTDASSVPGAAASSDALPDNEGAALHPRFSLALREVLDGQSITGSNVCVVVGTVTHQQRKPKGR